MAVEPGHVQITEFSKEAIPSIMFMLEDLFCRYGTNIPYFCLDYDFPDYSERPDWVSGYNFNLDWGAWGYWLPWFNNLLGLLFDTANLPRWQMPDFSEGSVDMFNSKMSELYEMIGRIYVGDYSNNRVVVFNTNLQRIDSFSVTAPFGMTVDANYVYITSLQAGNDKIVKHNRLSPYAEVDSVEVNDARDLDQDTLYVYLAEKTSLPAQHYYVTIIQKSNMSIARRFDAFPLSSTNKTMEGVAVDDDYIYCSGQGSLKKFYKDSPYSEVAENDAVGAASNYLSVDSNYIYFTNDNGGIDLYNKDDLSLISSISDASRWHYHSIPLGDHIYSTFPDYHTVIKIKISDDTKVAEFGLDGESGDDELHLSGPGPIAAYMKS